MGGGSMEVLCGAHDILVGNFNQLRKDLSDEVFPRLNEIEKTSLRMELTITEVQAQGKTTGEAVARIEAFLASLPSTNENAGKAQKWDRLKSHAKSAGGWALGIVAAGAGGYLIYVLTGSK
jgi:hypothetical protein